MMTASRALCAPRAGTVMEMGCSSPTSLQAACGAHDHDWCDAGCHLEEVTHVLSSMAPRSPLPTTVPTVGGRRSLAVVPQLVCSNSSNHCMCADEVGAPPVPRGLRGDSQDSAGKGLCCPDSADLPAESAGAALCRAMCWGGHPHPPGPRSQLRAHGKSQTTPKLAPPCRARDLQRYWGP